MNIERDNVKKNILFYIIVYILNEGDIEDTEVSQKCILQMRLTLYMGHKIQVEGG